MTHYMVTICAGYRNIKDEVVPCGKEIRRTEVQTPHVGVSHGICKKCVREFKRVITIQKKIGG